MWGGGVKIDKAKGTRKVPTNSVWNRKHIPGFKVYDLGFRVEGLGFRMEDLRFGVEDLGLFRV